MQDVGAFFLFKKEKKSWTETKRLSRLFNIFFCTMEYKPESIF